MLKLLFDGVLDPILEHGLLLLDLALHLSYSVLVLEQVSLYLPLAVLCLGVELLLLVGHALAVVLQSLYYLMVVLRPLLYLLQVVVQNLPLGLLQVHPLREQGVLPFRRAGARVREQARHLIHLVEEAITALAVVAMQEAVVLHVFQRVPKEARFLKSVSL